MQIGEWFGLFVKAKLDRVAESETICFTHTEALMILSLCLGKAGASLRPAHLHPHGRLISFVVDFDRVDVRN
jgi:hypothetical protein